MSERQFLQALNEIMNYKESSESKVNESYGDVYIKADIKAGFPKETIIKKIQSRYSDITDEEAEKIYNAVESGEGGGWPTRESKVNERGFISPGTEVDYHGRTGKCKGYDNGQYIIYFSDVDEEEAIDEDELREQDPSAFESKVNEARLNVSFTKDEERDFIKKVGEKYHDQLDYSMFAEDAAFDGNTEILSRVKKEIEAKLSKYPGITIEESKVNEVFKTEEDVSKFVEKNAKITGKYDERVSVKYGDKLYQSEDTHDLVVQICKDKRIACESKVNEVDDKEVDDKEVDKKDKDVHDISTRKSKRGRDDHPDPESVTPKDDEEEVPEIEKEYLGKTEDTHFYLIFSEEDLQILDQEGVLKYSAKDNNLDMADTNNFIIQAIQEIEIEAIERSVFMKYILPLLLEEEPEEELEDEEKEIPEIGEEEKKKEEPVESKNISKALKKSAKYGPTKNKTKKIPTKKKESKVDEEISRKEFLLKKKSRLEQELEKATKDIKVKIAAVKSDLDKLGPADAAKESKVEEGALDDFEAEDTVEVIIDGKPRLGKIKKIHRLGDMADVDFGKGDVYGIHFNRMTIQKCHNEAKESKKKLIETQVSDEENTFEVSLVDDGSEDTVIDINGREFRFSSDFADLWRNEEGGLSKEGLTEIALDALANLEEEDYGELVGQASAQKDAEKELDRDSDEVGNFKTEERNLTEEDLTEKDIKDYSDEQLSTILDHLERVERVGFKVSGRMKEVKVEIARRKESKDVVEKIDEHNWNVTTTDQETVEDIFHTRIEGAAFLKDATEGNEVTVTNNLGDTVRYRYDGSRWTVAAYGPKRKINLEPSEDVEEPVEKPIEVPVKKPVESKDVTK